MPLYRFNFRDQRGLCPDEDGLEFPSLERAYLEAFEAAQRMWSELLQQRQNPMRCAFEIADDAGETLLVLPFSEVLRAAQGGRRRSDRSHVELFHEILSHRRKADRLLADIATEVRSVQAAMCGIRQTMASSV